MSAHTYRIGEAAELLQLETHVLRFWQSKFPQLAPLRTEKGQRRYTEEDVALLRRIKQLLHEQGMTIEGARRVLDGGATADEMLSEQGRAAPDPVFWREVRDELLVIRDILARQD